jgi:choline dehydrogenase
VADRKEFGGRMSEKSEHDFVIVGSGSAGACFWPEGSAMLVRVSPPAGGGRVRQKDFWVRVPIGIAKIVPNKDYVWQFYTKPQAGLLGQRIYWPRGRLPGGSSSVNGMIFSRGDPVEFDYWREQGSPGWGWKDLLPYFKRLEHCAFGDAQTRGRNGPISIQSLGDHPDVLSDAFLASCGSAGIERTQDYNAGYGQYGGVSYLQLLSAKRKRRHGGGLSGRSINGQTADADAGRCHACAV